MRFLPAEDRIYCVLDSIEDKKVGTLILSVQRALVRLGTIKEVGAGVDYKPGDRILVSAQAGLVVDLPELGTDHDQHRILSVQEILAVVQE